LGVVCVGQACDWTAESTREEESKSKRKLLGDGNTSPLPPTHPKPESSVQPAAWGGSTHVKGSRC
jgi:hypothetical protein